MTKATKTLEYRRAYWPDGARNLESLARKAWMQFWSHLERTVTSQDGVSISGLTCKEILNGGFAIRCAKYIDRQAVGVIPMEAISNVNLGEQHPHVDENYLSSDFMALICNNYVIVLNAGPYAGVLRWFLAELFRKANFRRATRQFELRRIGRIENLAMIQAIGVRTIDLNLAIDKATGTELMQLESPGVWNSAMQHAGKLLQAIVAQDKGIDKLREAEKGTVTISLNVKKDDLDVAKNGLNYLARVIAEDEYSEDFNITLRNGQKIRHSEIVLSKQVRVDRSANSVDVNNAWDEMELFYEELKTRGYLRI